MSLVEKIRITFAGQQNQPSSQFLRPCRLRLPPPLPHLLRARRRRSPPTPPPPRPRPCPPPLPPPPPAEGEPGRRRRGIPPPLPGAPCSGRRRAPPWALRFDLGSTPRARVAALAAPAGVPGMGMPLRSPACFSAPLVVLSAQGTIGRRCGRGCCSRTSTASNPRARSRRRSQS